MKCWNDQDGQAQDLEFYFIFGGLKSSHRVQKIELSNCNYLTCEELKGCTKYEICPTFRKGGGARARRRVELLTRQPRSNLREGTYCERNPAFPLTSLNLQQLDPSSLPGSEKLQLLNTLGNNDHSAHHSAYRRPRNASPRPHHHRRRHGQKGHPGYRIERYAPLDRLKEGNGILRTRHKAGATSWRTLSFVSHSLRKGWN